MGKCRACLERGCHAGGLWLPKEGHEQAMEGRAEGCDGTMHPEYSVGREDPAEGGGGQVLSCEVGLWSGGEVRRARAMGG